MATNSTKLRKYCQKVAISLAQEFSEPIPQTRYQKLLFLLSLEQEKPSYFFVPYYYGCYSFSAAADRERLAAKGFLEPSFNGWKTCKEISVWSDLTETDRGAIAKVATDYGKLSTTKLIQLVYDRYPYYTRHSRIRGRFGIATGEPSHKEVNSVPGKLYTIGYESLCIEEFVNRLIESEIHLLVDVRKNPISRKFGFSKTRLSAILQNMKIQYRHLPGLGIPTDIRNRFLSLGNRTALFEWYKSSVLSGSNNDVRSLHEITSSSAASALVCFEKNHIDCHRSHLAEFISEKANNSIVHL
ncbi:MAG: DUF488 domain-containing protein [Spirochaetales bacterium]|jgi:hypothetical protein|nr:DUF488 domain-containing protein [Spirochaetales bacterium]